MTVMLVVGFTAAPTAAADGTGVSVDSDGISVDVGDDVSIDAGEDGVDVDENVETPDGEVPDTDVETPDPEGTVESATQSNDDDEDQFPEELCTDVPSRVDENVPYGQVPWFDDLPSEAQPPGVPTDVLTPEAVAGIVFGATPNQCEIQDPNDPSYDPREDNVDPDADVKVTRAGEYRDGGVAVVYYEATLDQSSENGPGVSGVVGGLGTTQFGDLNPEVSVQDGEKEYAVDPQVRYWDNGTTYYAKNDVRLLNSRLGVEVDCDGEECQPGTRGLPQFVEPPAIPAPTGEDDSNSDDQFPEELCTDVPSRVDENVPYGQVPWFDDLPSEAQPPGVPTDVLTPEAVAGIVFGATPNQCEIQDPNDPSYDPREDNVDPGADVKVTRAGEYRDGGVAVVYYEATLDQSSENGPGVSGVVGGLGTTQFGDLNPEIAVHDGEKEYAVDPQVRYWDNGTTYYAKNDVRLLNSRLGVEIDCDGEECQPGTRGLPQFVEPPAIPAPTGE